MGDVRSNGYTLILLTNLRIFKNHSVIKWHAAAKTVVTVEYVSDTTAKLHRSPVRMANVGPLSICSYWMCCMKVMDWRWTEVSVVLYEDDGLKWVWCCMKVMDWSGCGVVWRWWTEVSVVLCEGDGLKVDWSECGVVWRWWTEVSVVGGVVWRWWTEGGLKWVWCMKMMDWSECGVVWRWWTEGGLKWVWCCMKVMDWRWSECGVWCCMTVMDWRWTEVSVVCGVAWRWWTEGGLKWVWCCMTVMDWRWTEVSVVLYDGDGLKWVWCVVLYDGDGLKVDWSECGVVRRWWTEVSVVCGVVWRWWTEGGLKWVWCCTTVMDWSECGVWCCMTVMDWRWTEVSVVLYDGDGLKWVWCVVLYDDDGLKVDWSECGVVWRWWTEVSVVCGVVWRWWTEGGLKWVWCCTTVMDWSECGVWCCMTVMDWRWTEVSVVLYDGDGLKWVWCVVLYDGDGLKVDWSECGVVRRWWTEVSVVCGVVWRWWTEGGLKWVWCCTTVMDWSECGVWYCMTVMDWSECGVVRRWWTEVSVVCGVVWRWWTEGGLKCGVWCCSPVSACCLRRWPPAGGPPRSHGQYSHTYCFLLTSATAGHRVVFVFLCHIQLRVILLQSSSVYRRCVCVCVVCLVLGELEETWERPVCWLPSESMEMWRDLCVMYLKSLVSHRRQREALCTVYRVSGESWQTWRDIYVKSLETWRDLYVKSGESL